MCLPFKHDWKDHLKVYHETRWVGAVYFIFPTRTVTLGRQCTKCGKWKPYVDGASAPKRGRVKKRRSW